MKSKAVDKATIKLIINACDPIGLLKMGAPADEYNAEIATIYQKIDTLEDVNEAVLADVIDDVFTDAFGFDMFNGRQDECIIVARNMLGENAEDSKNEVKITQNNKEVFFKIFISQRSRKVLIKLRSMAKVRMSTKDITVEKLLKIKKEFILEYKREKVTDIYCERDSYFYDKLYILVDNKKIYKNIFLYIKEGQSLNLHGYRLNRDQLVSA